MTRTITLTPLPKSWWAIYTEAILGSRGLKTESQQWHERMERDARLLRDIEAAGHSAYFHRALREVAR